MQRMLLTLCWTTGLPFLLTKDWFLSSCTAVTYLPELCSICSTAAVAPNILQKKGNSNIKILGLFPQKLQFKYIIIFQFTCIAGRQCCIAAVSCSSCLLITGEHSEAAQGKAVVMPGVPWCWAGSATQWAPVIGCHGVALAHTKVG